MKTKINFIKIFLVLIILIPVLTSCSEEAPCINVIAGENQQIIDGDDIYNNTEAISFPVVVRSSGEKPVEAEYKGIELVKLFSFLEMDITAAEKITFNAADGYRIILDADEIKEPRNAYLTFERDGEHLKSKKQGGNGPFQLIIRHDPFSQRWIKHVDEIIIE